MKVLSTAEKPSKFFEWLDATGMLWMVLPEFIPTIGCEQPKKYHSHDVWGHLLMAMDFISKEKPLVRLAALAHDLGKPKVAEYSPEKRRIIFHGHDILSAKITTDMMRRLKFSKKDIEFVSLLVSQHMRVHRTTWTNKAYRRFALKLGSKKTIKDMLLLFNADIYASSGRREEVRDIRYIRDKLLNMRATAVEKDNLAINGHDIMKYYSIGPGPAIGKVKNFLHDKILEDPELNEKESLMKILMEMNIDEFN